VKFSANKKYLFYPDVKGNLDLPEGERLAVEIIRPTAEDHGTLVFTELVTQQKKDAAGRDFTATSAQTRFNASKILRFHVGAVKNLIIADAGKETAITNGEELAAASFAGMFPLVSAICAEVCSDKITDAQKKISESDSGSSGTDGMSANSGQSTPKRRSS